MKIIISSTWPTCWFMLRWHGIRQTVDGRQQETPCERHRKKTNSSVEWKDSKTQHPWQLVPDRYINLSILSPDISLSKIYWYWPLCSLTYATLKQFFKAEKWLGLVILTSVITQVVQQVVVCYLITNKWRTLDFLAPWYWYCHRPKKIWYWLGP